MDSAVSELTDEHSLQRSLESARGRARELQAERDELRRLLDAIVDTIPSPVYVMDREHRLVFANEAYANLLATTRDELVGRLDSEFLAEASNEEFRANDDAFFASGENFANEECLVDAWGDRHIITTRRSLYRDADGRQLQICAMRDITNERVRMNEALELIEGIDEQIMARSRELSRANDTLQQQNEYLGALHETGLGLLRHLDLQSLLSALVVRAGQLLDTPHGFVYLLDEEAGAMRRTIGTGRYEHHESATVGRGVDVAGEVWERGATLLIDDYQAWAGRPEGADPELRAVVGVPLLHRGVGGGPARIAGVIGVALDRASTRSITPVQLSLLERFAQLASIALDNAKLYAAAQEARVAAERANKAKSVFLANMSHELRTPLNAILGFTELVKRKSFRLLPSRQLGNLDKVTRSAEHLLGLINTILDISKIEAGRAEVRPASFDFAALARDCIRITQPLVKGDETVMSWDIAEDSIEMYSDAGKIKQILINLLSNAARFTPAGSIVLAAWREGEDICAAVRDTGIGIAEDMQEKVFEEFHQVDTRSLAVGGTGLGLTISRRLAKLLGGSLTLVSALGEGSTFTLQIPARYPVQTT